MALTGFDDRLAQERRARLQAERLLAQRSEELYSANKKLSEHAFALSHQVIEQREENAALVGQTSQARAELDIATEKADIAERRLWDSLTAVEDGFAIFDRDWRLVVANDAFKSAFDDLADVSPGASYEALLRMATEEGVVDLEGEAPDEWMHRMMLRWESDTIPQIDIKLWNGAFVRLIDKRTPDGDIVSIALDITDTVKRERELRKARDEAEAAARAKSAFLANMSHEIRTPMNGVVSMAELLSETELDEDQKTYADTIRNSGEALLVIINDVLDYSKIDADKLTLHEESFDLEKMIHEIFRLLKPSLGEKDLELKLDYDIFLPDLLVGDPGRIRQILTNLIGNAVKFTESGEVLVQVLGDHKLEDRGRVPLRVLVHDTGIGIPHDLQGHIFGEFNQAESDANRSFDGTGLGLAITQRLLALMGGDVWVTSEPGEGSCFGFNVVLDADPEAMDTPIPPLPEARNELWVITGPEPISNGILAHILRLRARMVETKTATKIPDTANSVIIGPSVPDRIELVHELRDAGLMSPILVLGDEDAPDGTLPGVVFGPEEPNLPDIYRALAKDDVVLPEPIVEEAPVAAEEVAEVEEAPESPAEPRKLRLLAAEDNKTNQLVFKTMLKTLDLDLTLVENGRLSFEAYQADPPDVLFTDISMPEMDGIESARAIRAFEEENGLPRVPIVAMTAHAMDDDRDRILAAGIDGYLTKPLKKAELHEFIRASTPEGVTV